MAKKRYFLTYDAPSTKQLMAGSLNLKAGGYAVLDELPAKKSVLESVEGVTIKKLSEVEIQRESALRDKILIKPKLELVSKKLEVKYVGKAKVFVDTNSQWNQGQWRVVPKTLWKQYQNRSDFEVR